MIYLTAIVIVCFGGAIIISQIERRQKRRAAQMNVPTPRPESPARITNVQPGYVRTTIAELKQYAETHGGNIGDLPEYVMMTHNNVDGTIDVPDSVFATIDRAIDRRAKHDALYQLISEHRVNGMTCEDNGDESGAIDAYMSAVHHGERSSIKMLHAYRYAYDRLLVLLRRAHRYDELRAVCESYARHDIDDKTRTRINNIIESI